VTPVYLAENNALIQPTGANMAVIAWETWWWSLIHANHRPTWWFSSH